MNYEDSMDVHVRIIREVFTLFVCALCKKKLREGYFVGLSTGTQDKSYNICKDCYAKLLEKYRKKHGVVYNNH